jgi:hypothetical protein
LAFDNPENNVGIRCRPMPELLNSSSSNVAEQMTGKPALSTALKNRCQPTCLEGTKKFH